jgi:hypothetical protein
MQSQNVSWQEEHHEPKREQVSPDIIMWYSPKQPIANHKFLNITKNFFPKLLI